MATVTWYKGMAASVKALVTNAASKALGDPSTISLTITKPDGSTEIRTFTRLTTGEYEGSSTVQLTAAGIWKFLCTTTGTNESAKPVSITVYDV